MLTFGEMMTVVDEIFELFRKRGSDAYFGEPVSQEEHALQSACAAEKEGAPDALVVAALLHDLGHLLHQHEEDVADRGIDARHEAVGDAWLRRHFGLEVTEPARLHVATKRYLCAVDAGYRDRLSPASIQSLALQGGPMNAEEVAQFERNRHYREAVRLRGWDDMAKIPGLEVPGLEHYREQIAQRVEADRPNI